MSDNELDEIECKRCKRVGPKNLFFSRKKKQVTCDDCLDKIKEGKAGHANEKILQLEQRVADLESRLKHETEAKEYYEKQFRLIAESYTKTCLDVKTITKLLDAVALKKE
jgi:ribosomal protein S27E